MNIISSHTHHIKVSWAEFSIRCTHEDTDGVHGDSQPVKPGSYHPPEEEMLPPKMYYLS